MQILISTEFRLWFGISSEFDLPTSPRAAQTGVTLVNEKFTRVILFALSKCDDATKHTHVCVCMRNDRQRHAASRSSLLASPKARVCMECEYCRSHLFILIINYVIYRANRVEMVAFTFILAYHLSHHCRRYCRSDNGIHKCASHSTHVNEIKRFMHMLFFPLSCVALSKRKIAMRILLLSNHSQCKMRTSVFKCEFSARNL